MNNTKMKLDEKEVRRAYTDYYKNGLSWRKIEQKYGIYRTTMMTYFAKLGLQARDKKQLMYVARRLAMNNEEMLECVIRKKNGETVDALTLEKRVSGSLMQAVMTYFSRGYITGVQDGLKGINRLEGDKDGKSAR